MGLKIFNFLIDNILIDSENMGYFNYRKLINVFQQNLLFHMMNICRCTCKFLLANTLNLQQFLLVADPMSKVVVSGSQDINLISTNPEDRKSFFSRNTVYNQIAKNCREKNGNNCLDTLNEYLHLAENMETGTMNIWDYFKFFPMFESFFGEKELYLSQKEKTFFSKMTPGEISRINFYREHQKHFNLFKFSGISKDVLILSIEVLYKIVNFPFNFTYFDYSSEPKMNDISIIIYPEGILPLLLDFEFYSLMHQFYLGCKSKFNQSPSRSLLQHGSRIERPFHGNFFKNQTSDHQDFFSNFVESPVLDFNGRPTEFV